MNFLMTKYCRKKVPVVGVKLEAACSSILKVLVNNFSVMLGRSHRFLGITSTFGESVLGLEPPTSGSGVQGINHQATALPRLLVCFPIPSLGDFDSH